MAIAHVGTDASGTATATSLTFSHAVPAGSDRLLVVTVAARDTVGVVPIPTGVTFNGVAMTKHEENNLNELGSSVWRLVAPAETTANVVITMTNASAIVGAALNYTGVHQTTPMGTPNGGNGASSAVTVDVTSATDELVIDAVYVQIGGVAPVVGAGQTSRINLILAGEHYLVVSDEAGAATVTMSWTLGAAVDWVTSGVSMKPSAGGGGATRTPIVGVATLAPIAPIPRHGTLLTPVTP